MLMRILEPELMDTARDAEEYDAMDFTEPNTRFAEDGALEAREAARRAPAQGARHRDRHRPDP